MTFIALDDKEFCKGIYQNGNLVFNQLPENLDRTWKFISYLDGKNIDFIHLFCDGKDIGDLVPENLAPQWEAHNKRLTAYLKSFQQAKLNLTDNCIYDLIPKQFLMEFCELKCKIIDQIASVYVKPVNYDFSVKLESLLSRIRNKPLKIDLKSINHLRHTIDAREFLKNIDSFTRYIDFNQFGTKTGRLTTKKKTFPILNLNSDFRSIIHPHNDLFLEIDYNAAELRVLLALSGQKQPDGDIHQWNANCLGISREQAKKDVFAWLYGSTQVSGNLFEQLYQTRVVLNKYYDGKIVTNYFGRRIESDDFHALNHIVQSTSSDMVLRQALKVDAFLKEKKSAIGFIIHDSLVFDISGNELDLFSELTNIFSECEFGRFPVRVYSGKDFGSLKEVK